MALVRIIRILTLAEHRAMQDEAIAKGWYRNDRRMFTPGMAWYQPWYFAPQDWPEKASWGGSNRGPKCQHGDPFLSINYWQDWADKRPPIEVVGPNGETWEIDRKSSNGTGWVVTGDLPNVTCSPSIVLRGYHGFLKNGEFSADIEGRGDTGISQ